MCDQSTKQVVRDEVIKKVSKSESFTAFDITKLVRRTGIGIRHNECKFIVHAMYREEDIMPEFQRTLVQLPGVSIQPWLYHPDSQDPDDYARSFRSDLPAGSAPQVPSSLSTPSTKSCRNLSANDDGSFDRSAGKEGYLYVPVMVLQDLNLVPGDDVSVSAKQDEVLLSRDHGQASTTSCKVDVKGNIRLSKSILPSGDTFRIEIKGTNIKVSPTNA